MDNGGEGKREVWMNCISLVNVSSVNILSLVVI